MSKGLDIQLEGDPETVYGPGDQVSGNVVLTLQKTRAMSKASVRLQGRCEVQGFPDMRYLVDGAPLLKYKVDFFEEQITFLYETKVLGGVTRWPFTFKFPLNSELAVTNAQAMDAIPLPSAFNFSGPTWPPQGRISIVYRIHVLLIPERTNRMTPEALLQWKSQKRLRFYNPATRIPMDRFVVKQHSMTSIGQSKRRCPSVRDKHRSPKQMWKRCFKRDSVDLRSPRIIIEASAETREALTHGQQHPLCMSITCNSIGNVDDARIKLVLTQLSVDITTHTEINIPGRTGLHTHKKQRFSAVKRNSIQWPMPTDGSKFYLLRNWGLPEDPACAPSLDIWNIKRWYTIDVGMKLHIGSIGWCFKSSIPFEVYESPTTIGSEKSIRAYETGQHALGCGQFDVRPPIVKFVPLIEITE
ncbi:hypothetical protein K402DRAFT_274550 [Aulographum hederae CBS 113979]|uniref:Uncharacterized protein n=1 Tax=Aulographum hederae CBS 113979 TaxID=1176131 RepID=A0A6G1H997_9PEZI|nr:hypothetical protein K402DRAFT_274550 [Aulographum hederae CBS 113979]